MNPFLAELYNTADNVGMSKTASHDTEKLAQAAILDQMFASEGIDVNKLSGNDIVKVAAQIFGADSPLVKEAEASCASEAPEEEKKEEKEEEMAEKMAEADFLGRQMAHAYVAELADLEKQAVSAEQAKRAVKNLGQAAKYLGGKAATGTDDAAKRLGSAAARHGRMSGPITEGKARALGYGIAGGGTAGAAGLGAAALKDKDKEASALDALALQRAEEMLKQAGYIQDSPEAQLEAAVQARAIEMLKEAGYKVG